MRLHDQQAARQLLARAHPPRQGRGRQFRLGREANPGALRRVRQQRQQAFRLRRLNEARLMAGQARNRAGQCRQDPARQLRHLNEASLMANQASNPVRRFRRGQARQFRHLSGVRLMAGQARNLAARSHLRLTAKVARYHLQNMAGRRRESLVRVQVPPRVVLRIFRHKVAARDPQVSDLAIRQDQQARVHPSVVHLNIGRSPPARLRVKQAAREKEGRALMVNPVGRHHQEAERPLLAGRPEVEHLPLAPSTVKSSHNTERSNQRKERHGQGRNNSAVIL